MRLLGYDFHERPMPPSSEDAAAWRPYVETCIEAFGPERSMFESNFPSDKGQCSYQVIFNAFKAHPRALQRSREDGIVLEDCGGFLPARTWLKAT
jgi:predicted TIM-barrel fold metal-dependent hydrolase